jgi:hypothetical protein
MNTEWADFLWSVFMGSGLAAARRPGMTSSDNYSAAWSAGLTLRFAQ